MLLSSAWLQPGDGQNGRSFLHRLPVLLEHRRVLSRRSRPAAMGRRRRRDRTCRPGVRPDRVRLPIADADAPRADHRTGARVGRLHARDDLALSGNSTACAVFSRWDFLRTLFRSVPRARCQTPARRRMACVTAKMKGGRRATSRILRAHEAVADRQSRTWDELPVIDVRRAAIVAAIWFWWIVGASATRRAARRRVPPAPARCPGRLRRPCRGRASRPARGRGRDPS